MNLYTALQSGGDKRVRSVPCGVSAKREETAQGPKEGKEIRDHQNHKQVL